MIRQVFERAEKIGRIWCRLMHNSVAWPIHGRYQCRTCMRHFFVPWDARDTLSAGISLATKDGTAEAHEA